MVSYNLGSGVIRALEDSRTPPYAQIVGDSMRGVGKARGPMVIIMTNICVIRTILLFAIVPRWQDIRAVAVAYPITWALTTICMLVYYIHYHKHSQAIR